MVKCKCAGHVVFGKHAPPTDDAVKMWCRACGHQWRDSGERCTVGLFSDVVVPWCPQCGSVQATPLVLGGYNKWVTEDAFMKVISEILSKRHPPGELIKALVALLVEGMVDLSVDTNGNRWYRVTLQGMSKYLMGKEGGNDEGGTHTRGNTVNTNNVQVNEVATPLDDQPADRLQGLIAEEVENALDRRGYTNPETDDLCQDPTWDCDCGYCNHGTQLCTKCGGHHPACCCGPCVTRTGG